MNRTIYLRLSVMMFLQFFIWGGWFVTLGTFLGNNLSASDGQIGLAFSTQSWGAIIAPFVVGLIADRFLNAEHLLAAIHLAGAVLMYQMANAVTFGAFYWYVLPYMILYMPTLALVNSVSFRQLEDPSKEFSKIRVWGSIGWIVAGLIISYVFAWDSTESIAQGKLKNTFLLTAIASALLGLHSLTLPATPPVPFAGKKRTLGGLLGLGALGMLKDRNYRVFFFSSILICIPLAFYYQNTNPFLTEIGVSNPTGKMTFGQMSEVLLMLLLPVFLTRFGIKVTLLAGMLAWAVRYSLFAFGNASDHAWMLILGIALHGICYDFFFVAGQILTDSKAGEHDKSSAQGLITLATYGLGMLIGFSVAGRVSDLYVSSAGHNWKIIWCYPGTLALVVMTIFFALFKSEKIVHLKD